MGWFWSADHPPKPAGEGIRAAAPPPRPPAAQPHPDDDSDPELQKFLAMFTQELRGSAATPTPPPASPPPPPSPPAVSQPGPSSWFSRRPRPATDAAHPPPADTATAPVPAAAADAAAAPTRERTPGAAALAESLLPTSMSCRQAFDLAWGCQSPVGQFTAVYRYGGPRQCGELWTDFFFCMRARTLAPGPKAAAIREHYRRKEDLKYGPGKPSSEDVWRSRDEKVAPGTAFAMRLDDAPSGVTDEEQIRSDLESRRRIRQDLGYEKPSSGTR